MELSKQVPAIIQDLQTESFEREACKDLMKSIADQMNAELSSERVLLTLKDQYYNMKQVIERYDTNHPCRSHGRS